jgi:hypothetical protein
MQQEAEGLIASVKSGWPDLEHSASWHCAGIA